MLKVAILECLSSTLKAQFAEAFRAYVKDFVKSGLLIVRRTPLASGPAREGYQR